MDNTAKDYNNQDLIERTRKYSSLRYRFAIIDTVYLVILLYIALSCGLSGALNLWLSKFFLNRILIIPVYIFVVFLIYSILDFPLLFYHSFVVEHKFSLSRQNFFQWFIDQIKSGIISYIISAILFIAFYFIVSRYHYSWWFIISLIWILFSFIIAKLFPVLIIPMFFKCKELSDVTLKERIINLAAKMRVKVLNVFEIDFSKKTVKANAAFVGWGKTRRVILADTLTGKYSYDEIEVILAHEFAHYQHRHLLKLIFINSSVTLISFYLIFKTSSFLLRFFSISSLDNISSFPLVVLYFVIFGIIMQPLQNYLSRRFEKDADIGALKSTGFVEAFISMMEKLSAQNLSERSPSKVIKFLFFDHPPIEERIKMAKEFKS